MQSILDKGFTEINAVSRDDGRRDCIFTQKEWDQMQEMSDILEPFKIETDNLQGEKVVIPLKISSILKVGLNT